MRPYDIATLGIRGGFVALATMGFVSKKLLYSPPKAVIPHRMPQRFISNKRF